MTTIYVLIESMMSAIGVLVMYLSPLSMCVHDICMQGRPQDLGGGGPRIFFSDLGICMSRSDMLRMAKPCALLGGFGGMLPRENFLKRCNLVSFRVYFDQILPFFI